MNRRVVSYCVILLSTSVAMAETPPAILASGFIYESAPFPQCHASTIEESNGGLVASWFGGTKEGHQDVGIWVSRQENGQWSAPVEVANGKQEDGKQHPCWNPVLFQPAKGPLLLFYKVGPDVPRWWGMKLASSDGGATWSGPERIADGFYGPIKNKPIQLADGALLCPSSVEDKQGWRVHLERTEDLGSKWRFIGPVAGPFAAIQPTLLKYPDRKLQILNRTKEGVVAESWSTDNGETWSPLAATSLPNNNSGLDGVTLADGRQLLVYNHIGVTPGKWGGPRSPLNVAISSDGKEWKNVLALETEKGEYSYPAVIQAKDGKVHTTYTWKRQKVKHVVLDPAKLN